jgi:DNA repair protein RadD
MQLYDFQEDLKNGIYNEWQSGNRNVVGVLPTGAGKTVTFSSILHDHKGASAAIAHRKELVGQISLALAREGVTHGIIGPQATVKEICNDQAREVGNVFYDPNASVKVAGIDTLIRRQDELARWAEQVTLWVTDECHHLLTSNKWGQGIDMFPNAFGLGVTATPCRADGKGLGRHAHGVFDAMVVGPNMRQLIARGFLTDYRIFAPQTSDLDISQVETGADGDFKKPQLTKAVRESRIIGDIVNHYLRIAPGKLGITFVTDVETAKDVARQYNAMGVPAEVVDAKTPSRVRTEILRRFRSREITQLVNVDLFGEGFDLPAVEVVSFGRPTQSYGLYVQQFGRALRLLDGKEWAIIIDHVGNVVRHGLPDRERMWSLDAREARPRMVNPDDDVPLRYCTECTQPYERSLVVCPYCGTKWEPSNRSGPEYVDGDLHELSPAVLAEMRGEVAKVNMSVVTMDSWMRGKGMPNHVIRAAVKNHGIKQVAQEVLRDRISWWAAWQREMGRDDAEIYRRFYFAFDTDIMTAQTLGRNEATKLAMEVDKHIEDLKRGKILN